MGNPSQDDKQTKNSITRSDPAKGGGVHRALAIVWLLIWYGLAIYLVVVTLGIQQFQARKNAVAATSSKTFTGLSILESEERSAAAAVQAAHQALAASEPEIRAIRAKIEEFEIGSMESAANATIADTDQEKDKLSAESAFMTGRIALAQKRLDQIFEPKRAALERVDEIQKQLTPADRTALEKLRRLNEEKLQFKTYAKWFLSMPQELLTLILTLSMGIFGSTIAVSRTFFDTRIEVAQGMSWYLFRPIQGAVMALTIYILFKAGILIFSAPPSNGNVSGALNPFFIAFLGIISGLFAEYAYERLDRAAKSVFQAPPTAARAKALWAKGVDQELTAQNKSRADLAAYLHQPLNVVDQWVEGKRPAPEEVQRIIAFWLGKPRDDLFYQEPTEAEPSGENALSV